MNIIITGSSGLIGSKLVDFYDEKSGSWEWPEYGGIDSVIGVDKQDIDLSDEIDVDCFFEINKADILINCFGLNHHIADMQERAYIPKENENLYTIPLDSFRRHMELNVTTLFNVCRKYAEYNKSGCVINFGSLYSHIIPDPEMSLKHPGYVASKHAVIGLTKYLAKYLPHIRFNCICPGGIENHQPQEFIDKYIDHTVIKRMCTIDDIIKACDYLINSGYVTGQSIIVDGGYSI